MNAKIELRKFPYPYRAALAICSDIDHTRTAEQFLEIQEFMNREIGLTFTNTFFPIHEQDDFSLFSSRSLDRSIILDHLKNGKIEALHGFGEKKDFVRSDAEKVLAELVRNHVRVKLWIDHADFPGNLCKYRCQGQGDRPGRKEYHLDVTADYGVKYIWTDRLTSINGQGAPITLPSLLRLLDPEHPLASGVNACKTALKLVLGWMNSKKYAFMAANEPVFVTTLHDGRKLFEFIRFNNYYQGAAIGDSFSELYYMISDKILKNLIARNGYSIVYVHLGKNFGLADPKNHRTIQALRGLKAAMDQGEIWVDTTLRLLEYYVKRRYLKWDYSIGQGEAVIRIRAVDDPVSGSYVPKPEDLSGLAFDVPDRVDVKIEIDQHGPVRTVVNRADDTGKVSVSIR